MNSLARANMSCVSEALSGAALRRCGLSRGVQSAPVRWELASLLSPAVPCNSHRGSPAADTLYPGPASSSFPFPKRYFTSFSAAAAPKKKMKKFVNLGGKKKKNFAQSDFLRRAPEQLDYLDDVDDVDLTSAKKSPPDPKMRQTSSAYHAKRNVDASVAIIGRSNVGKSTLFNRLLSGTAKRSTSRALTGNRPGTTRDRHSAVGVFGSLVAEFVDTGGIEDLILSAKSAILTQMRQQVEAALEEASVIFFVVDAKDGITPLDQQLADMLLKDYREGGKKEKPIVLLANKADGGLIGPYFADAYDLNCGDPVAVSAMHNEGMDDLYDRLVLELDMLSSREGLVSFYSAPPRSDQMEMASSLDSAGGSGSGSGVADGSSFAGLVKDSPGSRLWSDSLTDDVDDENLGGSEVQGDGNFPLQSDQAELEESYAASRARDSAAKMASSSRMRTDEDGNEIASDGDCAYNSAYVHVEDNNSVKKNPWLAEQLGLNEEEEDEDDEEGDDEEGEEEDEEGDEEDEDEDGGEASDEIDIEEARERYPNMTEAQRNALRWYANHPGGVKIEDPYLQKLIDEEPENAPAPHKLTRNARQLKTAAERDYVLAFQREMDAAVKPLRMSVIGTKRVNYFFCRFFCVIVMTLLFQSGNFFGCASLAAVHSVACERLYSFISKHEKFRKVRPTPGSLRS